VNVQPGSKCGSVWGCDGLQVGGRSRGCSGTPRCRGQQGRGAYARGEVGNAKALVEQLEVKRKAISCGVQTSCLGVRPTDNVEYGAAKVVCVLLEVRAGGR
jgi:hypothetical protein